MSDHTTTSTPVSSSNNKRTRELAIPDEPEEPPAIKQRRLDPSPSPLHIREGSSAIDPPPMLSVVGMLAPDSTNRAPKALFGVVQHCEPAPTGVGQKGDYRVRIAPLMVDKNAVHEFAVGYRMQIGRSFLKNASELVHPIDYTRDARGSFVIFTTARDIQEHVYA